MGAGKFIIMTTSDAVIRDYTAFTLRHSGYNIARIRPTETPTLAMRTMRTLGQQFDAAYNNAFDDMTADINIDGPEVDEAFASICLVLFENGIAWGRIVGLIVLSSKLSRKAIEANVPDQVDNIIQLTTSYLQSPRFTRWITEHGGWVS